MNARDFVIKMEYQHRIRFSHDVFNSKNPTINEILATSTQPARALILLEAGVAQAFPELKEKISSYLTTSPHINFHSISIVNGGENAKASFDIWQTCLDKIEEAQIDRHSWVFAIGGGAFLDVTGFAAAVAHRGIRFLRFPTTTLSQDDSGVGVKNGINAYGKKNFLGTFSVPFAVINDLSLLHGQPENIRRAGIIEAIKVALVKDADFFNWITLHAKDLLNLTPEILETCVERSAILHAKHIAEGGDPFELGSSRPLDFGHWSAHKLEQMSSHRLSHAEAVSIGIALDVCYANQVGIMELGCTQKILSLLVSLQMPIWDELLEACLSKEKAEISPTLKELWDGLDEFRQHLGGKLTVLMVLKPGSSRDIYELHLETFQKALTQLHQFAQVYR